MYCTSFLARVIPLCLVFLLPSFYEYTAFLKLSPLPFTQITTFIFLFSKSLHKVHPTCSRTHHKASFQVPNFLNEMSSIIRHPNNSYNLNYIKPIRDLNKTHNHGTTYQCLSSFEFFFNSSLNVSCIGIKFRMVGIS